MVSIAMCDPGVIHQLFERQAQRTPAALALVDGGERITYRQLNEWTDRLAQELRLQGIVSGASVPIMFPRSASMIASMLAVLKAGGAYLPIDPACPETRVEYMLRHARVEHLLIHRSLMDRVPRSLSAGNVLTVDDCVPELPAGPVEAVTRSAAPAYVIYTSGSTGKPKAVVITHANVVNLIKDLAPRFSLGPGRVVLAVTTIAFDIFIVETLLPLSCGATVVLASEEQQQDPALMVELMRRERVDVLQLTPSRLKAAIRRLPDLSFLKNVHHLLVGGEVFPRHLFHRLRGVSCKIFNLYGPTEATVYCVGKQLTEDGEVTIGKPLANNRAYIVDKANRQLSAGEVGELLIGGPGVGQGYLHSDEQTIERFVDDLFEPGERVYRTGDLAKWTAGGEIEFVGRADRQIKLRGYRIELEEIEQQWAAQPGVEDVVLEVLDESGRDPCLCGYYVSDHEQDPARMRAALAMQLPDYMIPSHFVRLDRIPLSPNGKVDRNSLPPPHGVAAAQAMAPRTKVERLLAQMWSDVLGIDLEQIGVDDGFLELGGHSLNAMLLVARIEQAFHVQIPLRQFFAASTITHLAALVAAAAKTRYAPIEPAGPREYYPLSPEQRRLFFLEALSDGGTAYNLPDVYVVDGEPDLKRLQEVFDQLIQRHVSLRTSFHLRGDAAVQRVHSHVPFEMEYAELAEDDLDATVDHFIRPFDLQHAPLMRAKVVNLRPGRYVLMTDLHHIVADGYSKDLLAVEFKKLYRNEPLPLPTIQYTDYVLWQERRQPEAIRHDQDFWLTMFERPVEPLRLPLDFPRPQLPDYRGQQIHFEIDSFKTDLLLKLTRVEGVSLFVGLLAVVNVFLSRLTGQSDIVIGTPVAGRTHVDVAHTIGMFVNTLAIRSKPGGERTFRAFLSEVNSTILGALDHQDYPFDRLVAELKLPRDASRNPLFDVLFVLQDTETKQLEIPGARLTPYRWTSRSSKIDLTIHVRPAANTLLCCLEYDSCLFGPDTIRSMRHQLTTVMEAVCGDPDSPLSDSLNFACERAG